MTHNNYQDYCLDSSWTLWDSDFSEISIISIKFHIISQQLKLFSTISSMRGEIHEQEVNLDNLLSFHGNTCSRYPSQGTQVMLTQDKETKKVWTLQPKPSQRNSLRSLGKVQECSLTQWLHNPTSCTCAALHSSRGAAQRSSGQQHLQQESWGASFWYANYIIQ